MIETTMKKKELRSHILDMRLALTADEVYEYSGIICRKLAASDAFKKAEDICLYMPIHNEVDVTLLFDDSLAGGKNIWLPKITGHTMDFYSFDGATNMVLGTYNIKEPESAVSLLPNADTLIVMPGSVFSKDCCRIGYGGGYYDRYLEQHPECMTIAVAYDFQVIDDIPTKEYDIKPKRIITNMEDYYA